MKRRMIASGLLPAIAISVSLLAAQDPEVTQSGAPPGDPVAVESGGAVADPDATDGPKEESTDAAPPFSATLLLLEADWSKSPTAAEVQADLERVIRENNVSLSVEQAASILASGPRILFSDLNVAGYSGERSQQLLRWLDHHKLIRSKSEFPAAQRLDLNRMIGRRGIDGQQTFETALAEVPEILPVPDLGKSEDSTSAPSSYHWEFKIIAQPVENRFALVRYLERAPFSPRHTYDVDRNVCEWHVPAGQAVFISPFAQSVPGRTQIYQRQLQTLLMQSAGIYPVVWVHRIDKLDTSRREATLALAQTNESPGDASELNQAIDNVSRINDIKLAKAAASSGPERPNEDASQDTTTDPQSAVPTTSADPNVSNGSNEGSTDAAPAFSATLLVLEADWSISPGRNRCSTA